MVKHLFGIVQFLYRLASATQSVTSACGSTNSFNLTQCTRQLPTAQWWRQVSEFGGHLRGNMHFKGAR